MTLDILIFAVIAAVLIYRLNAVLGTRHEDDPARPNPFTAPETQSAITKPIPAPRLAAPHVPLRQTPGFDDYVARQDSAVESGLEEIATADHSFELARFMAGAKYAFETIVTAYSKGERDTLKPLLSPKLYSEFESGIKAREASSAVVDTVTRRIKAARITKAHLGGAMAYITIDYDVEGGADHPASVEDIWTFTRDIRSDDPNWILIETDIVEK